MELATIKALLAITDTSRDALLTALIPIVLAEINAYTHQAYTAETLPVALQMAYAEIMRLHLRDASVTSESLGDYSASYESGYPAFVKTMLNAYRKVW